MILRENVQDPCGVYDTLKWKLLSRNQEKRKRGRFQTLAKV